MTIGEMRDRLIALNEQANAIRSEADSEKRNITDEESEVLTGLLSEFDRTEKELEQCVRLEEHNKRLVLNSRSVPPDDPGAVPAMGDSDPGDGRTADPPTPTRSRINLVPAQVAESRGKWGFQSLGEMAIHIKRASRSGGFLDPRLEARAPTTFGSEGVGADGGFAVAPEFSSAIMAKVAGEEGLLSRTDGHVASGNSMTFPKDETTPWQTTGGVQATWEGEGTQIAQSKILLEQTTVRLNKLSCLVPVTEELLEDAPALDSYLRRKVPEKMSAKIDLAILEGTGVGQPLGLLNAPGTVESAAGGASDTFDAADMLVAYQALYAGFRNNAVWIMNQNVEAKLPGMHILGTNSDQFVYRPAGGATNMSFATLMGRPVVFSQACKTLGDKGDIYFVDLAQYLTVQKTGGIRVDTSMHLWFDYDQMAFRFIFRLGGMPWFSSTIADRVGVTTYSAYVVVAERA